MKKPQKPQSAENAGTQASSLHARVRERTTDAEFAAAVIASGGRNGAVAQATGKSSRSVRKRTAKNAPKKELRGLPQIVRDRIRSLVREGVMAKLEEGDTKVLVEVMHSKLCRDMDLGPVEQKVELSGKVDGDVRLGLLDERAAARRLAQLTEGK